MKYSIINGHTGIHGSLLNLLDLQDHLIREGNEVDFYCNDIDTLLYNIDKTHRKYLTGNLKFINLKFEKILNYRYKVMPQLVKREWIYTTDTILTDFKTLINLKIPINSNRTIVFDTAELSYHLEGINIDFYPEDIGDLRKIVEKHNTRIDFLMPPVNLKKFKVKYPELFAYEYFKKINLDVLSTIRTNNNEKLFFRADEYADFPRTISPDIKSKFPQSIELKDMKTMFNHMGYIYYRRPDRAYWEQMGRLIWEFILLDKQVHFYDQPFEKSDGLNDYMKYYGTNKKEIEQMMSGAWL